MCHIKIVFAATMTLLPLCQRLAASQWSIALHESVYAYPIVESVHVWALCVFLGMAIMLDLRLVGVVMRDVPVSQVARRLLPWTVAGFLVMIASGILLFYAIPVRTYQNIFFRAKLVLLVLAGINAWVFHATIWRRVRSWDLQPIAPRGARVAGLASLVLWAGIVFAGRMIAYNWFDCAKQPPRVVYNLAGCTPETAAAHHASR
jgi:hypothetical protein